MKRAFLYLFILHSSTSIAQSTIHKSIDASEVEELEILLDNFFEIEITNTPSTTIEFSTVSEGEYKDQILIKNKRSEKTIILQDEIQPFSERYNDKLSAHKVFAVKAKIKIPKHLRVIIKSQTASLQVKGKLQNLFVELNAGDCILKPFIGSAKIHTWYGNILLYTRNANIKVSSKSGEIKQESMTGKHQIELKSISGNISVYKTK